MGGAVIQGEIAGAVIERAVAGDEMAFARIVAVHHEDMARIAYFVSGDLDVAADAAQAAWAITWRRLGTLRDPARLKAWLMSVAANEGTGHVGARYCGRLQRRRGSLLQGEPMSRYARTIRIEAPPAEVWAAIVDVERWPAWASQFKRIERLDSGPLAPNSRVRVRPNRMPAAVWQVTDYEEGRSFTWASSFGPGVLITGGHVVTSDDGTGTDAEFWLEASGTLGTLLRPLLRRTVFNRNTRSATQGLKRYMEGPGSASMP